MNKQANTTPTLRLHVLGSGSKGNASIIENAASGRCVVIDCGICKRDFFDRTEQAGIDPQNIEAVLITHEHTDHTKGLGVVTRGFAKLGLHPAIYASRAVHGSSKEICSLEESCDIRHFSAGDTLSLAGADIYAFHTSHDCVESFGFRITSGGDALGFMTDSGICTPQAREALQGCRILAIESNHDPKMLRNGPYPRALQQRIASDFGHLSNMQSADLLESLLCNELEEVVAMHISETNNTYDLPRDMLADVVARNTHPAQVRSGRQRTLVSL